MSAITDDIMQVAMAVYEEASSDGFRSGSVKLIARAIHSERQRTDDLIEEVKRVLGPFADIAPSVEYTDFRDGDVVHRQRVTTDGTADGPLLGWKELTKDHFRAARALLSKLGERT